MLLIKRLLGQATGMILLSYLFVLFSLSLSPYLSLSISHARTHTQKWDFLRNDNVRKISVTKHPCTSSGCFLYRPERKYVTSHDDEMFVATRILHAGNIARLVNLCQV